MKPFIQDRERILDATSDLLKTSVYAENLVKVIENTPEGKVFTIGVFGGWGTGKSSIISTAQDTIEKKHTNFKFITYDAWKYANDSFRRMFLLKIQQDLKMQQTEEMNRFYQSETAEAEPKTKLSAKGLSIIAGIILIIAVILIFWKGAPIEIKISIPIICTIGTFILALLNGCFYDLKISFSKPTLFAPEQFEACFKEMMSKCLKKNNWFQKTWTTIKDYVETGSKTITGVEKLVIVIDNIDRCPSDMAYQLLTDIKTFLSNEKYNLVFIVPVDDEALKKHLFRKWSKNKDDEPNINKEKEEFLRKFFNVTIRIKPHQETELLHFAHEINKENNLGYSNDTLSIVAKEFADTALILQEEYSDFYKKTTKNLNLIRNFTPGDANKDNEPLISFMRVANVTLKQTPLEALQRIFTNTSSLFSDLSVDIQKAINTYDTTTVIEYAQKNNELKTHLIDYALEKLKTEVKYGAVSQTTQWVEFLCQLYKANVFDDSRFSTINTILATFYKTAIPVISDQDALNLMGNRMNATSIQSLHDAIVDYLKTENAQDAPNFENVLRGYLTYNTSEQDSDVIAPVVTDFFISHPIDRNFSYTTSQIKHLFGDSFVAKQIENIAALNDKTRIDEIVWCITKNRELSNEIYTKLFNCLIELFGDTRGKGKEAYIEFIEYLSPIFASIDTSMLVDELTQIYNLVTSVRVIPDNYRNNYPQYNQKKSILDEVDERQAELVTSFCYEIIRISGGNIDVSNSINKLYVKCKDTVIEGALKIHSMGLSIATLANTLIKTEDYNNLSDLTLLEILLKRQSDDSMMLDKEVLENKIHSLVDNAVNNNVEKLLEKLVKDKEILDIVADYVASLDSEKINDLPVSIAKYAVFTFNRDNAEIYKDNVEFLILVLKQGNDSQKKEVVRLMKDKINKESDLDIVVQVLDNLVSNDQQMLKTLIGELDGIKDSDTVNEATKARIAELSTKLSNSIKKTTGVFDKLLGKKNE